MRADDRPGVSSNAETDCPGALGGAGRSSGQGTFPHAGARVRAAWMARSPVLSLRRQRAQLQHHSQVIADNPMLRKLVILDAVDMDVLDGEALSRGSGDAAED